MALLDRLQKPTALFPADFSDARCTPLAPFMLFIFCAFCAFCGYSCLLCLLCLLWLFTYDRKTRHDRGTIGLGLLPDRGIREDYGWAEIDPDHAVIAGETATWRVVYHAGKRGIDDGGVIKIAWRDVSDWQHPQFDDPAAPAYASVSTTGPATLKAVFDRQRYIRPWRYCVTIDVFDDSLAEGDSVTLVLGDTSAGSAGSRAQTFCQDAFEFRVAVDWCGTWVYTEVPSPKVPIVSGAPHRLVALGPSETTPDEATWIGIKAEDAWGNPCAEYTGKIKIDADGLVGLPETHAFDPSQRGAMRFEGVTAPKPGIYRVRAWDESLGLEAESNPLVSRATRKDPRPFWGDLHGQSEETVGTNSVESYFRFAREKAWLDFAGHQGNDFQITKSVWQEIKRRANTQNAPGKFAAFVGWEWSGNTPVGGDRNVYYPGGDGPLHRSSHVLIDDKSDVATDCQHVADLYRALEGMDALLIPHVGGRYANLAWHDPNLEAVIEVLSEWGEFEWFLREALERGYRVGFTCGSDDHKGRPGAAHPGSGAFGVYGGITCVYAEELTRESVWEALKARRCYGTNGPRVLVEMTVGGQPMGSDLTTRVPPEIALKVWGTAPIEKVDLFRGTDVIYTHPQTIPRQQNRVRIAWSGQRIRARNRLVRWDGAVRLDKGRIAEAIGFAFDSASEGIQSADDHSVTWTSVTTGDADGIILTLDAPSDATLDFETPVLSHSLRLSEIATGPVVIGAGGIDMQVVFERAPVGIGREVAFTYRENELLPGCHPYWARIAQIDGGKAWVSPVYVASQ